MDQVKIVEDSLIWTDMVCLADHIISDFLNAVFHKSYLVDSWILSLISGKETKGLVLVPVRNKFTKRLTSLNLQTY